ncbi:hypothetical protein Acy02nite_71560 [Actinoplanes cyaneus]|uniref:Uncharacterized protein n=1 Tax=Actinoplanes cyaneus TaxID=52696 RepID=A0A919M4D7_9ACTN|nr:hypothetical protein [Actinoplanes cyaneus]MCW2142257.1 hypothetical protein [Actinoplanes cyaneus]GID69275.1 hypothetical protein Acy02nite_71560 [Actinoplanes cyaneus]
MNVVPAAAPDARRSGAWIVDHAIRALATGRAAQGEPFPQVGAVVLGSGAVSLRLTTPAAAPPPGWDAEHDGRTWRAPLHRLETAAVDTRLPAPLPLLVSLGDTGEGRVLLNLAAADGIIGLEGDSVLAPRLAEQWSRQLTRGPWAGQATVIRVGFGPGPGFTGVDVDQLAQAAPLLSREAGTVLFAGRPDPYDLREAVQLVTGPERRWAVVAVGVDDATWRLRVDISGTVDTGLLDGPVRPAW